jgi:hypothetical protein
MYPLTFFVKALPADIGGMANGPVIRILEKYRDDVGLYQHELTHVKQWFTTLGLHTALYYLCRPYRQWSEVQAYRKQMTYGLSLDRAAQFLMLPRYDLRITTEEAKALLSSS